MSEVARDHPTVGFTRVTLGSAYQAIHSEGLTVDAVPTRGGGAFAVRGWRTAKRGHVCSSGASHASPRSPNKHECAPPGSAPGRPGTLRQGAEAG
jgi:hypothetical protein